MSRAVIADGMKAIDAIYRSRGYIYVFMNPENTEKPNHVVDVAVKITEGDQYRLGRIEFTGNKTTRDKVLRRELQVFEGDIMDMETFKKSLFKVTQLGYYKIEEDPDFRVNPEKKTVDVSIKGTDTNRNEVQFGAGYSQLDGLFGQFQFTTRNFLGRGDTLGLQFQRGNRSNFFDISFAEPWFLDQRMSVGGSVFNRTLDYSDVAGGLDQRSKGANLSLGYGLGLFDVVSIFYGFTDQQSTYQVYPPPPPPGGGTVPIAFATYAGKTSAVTPGYRYDSRNDPFDPTRGMKFGVSLSVAGGPFGGDFSYYKLSANATRYIPFGKKGNFAFNLDLGLLRAYSGEQDPAEIGYDSRIPLFERYRIGGDRSVRGFKYGSIYPLDSQNKAFFTSTGALLGGDRFARLQRRVRLHRGRPSQARALLRRGKHVARGPVPDPGIAAHVDRARNADSPADFPGAPAVHLRHQPRAEGHQGPGGHRDPDRVPDGFRVLHRDDVLAISSMMPASVDSASPLGPKPTKEFHP